MSVSRETLATYSNGANFMIYVQNYLLENFIFLMIVGGTYFIVFLKSSVDNSVKYNMVTAMTVLLLISINSFYLSYLHENQMSSTFFQFIYFVSKPLPMISLISIVDKNSKNNYIPAVINALIYSILFLLTSNKITVNSEVLNDYICVITEWVYWIIFLSLLNIRYYREQNTNSLGIFFYISILMTANILDFTGSAPGILVHTYAVCFLLYYLIVHVHISRQVVEEKELKLREQRVSMMLSQIRPHFLYNTLNTITALCRTNPKLAEETTIKFSKYLRENMYGMEQSGTHPFERELEHIKIYLDIEKLRFGLRLNVIYDIKSRDFNVPVLTLQPIVENAVKHGICSKIEGGTITIKTYQKGKDNIIIISDDGEGFDPNFVFNDGKEHIGIKNANERLKNTVKTEMQINSIIGVGTEVIIVIPGEKTKVKQLGGNRREVHSIGR